MTTSQKDIIAAKFAAPLDSKVCAQIAADADNFRRTHAAEWARGAKAEAWRHELMDDARRRAEGK